MALRVGRRYRSQVDATEIVVTKGAPGDVTLTCGGEPMIEHGVAGTAGLALKPDAAGGSLLGKRYTDERVEVLVTKPGTGTLAVDGIDLWVKAPKPLPASD